MEIPTKVEVSVELFRQVCPAFADTTLYPDAVVEIYLEVATSYVSDIYQNCLITVKYKTRQLFLIYMAAHLYSFFLKSTNNGTSATGSAGQILSTTIGEVTVSYVPPPNTQKQYQWWLNQTPYGQALLALLRAQVPVGIPVGGTNNRIYLGNNRHANNGYVYPSGQ